MVTCIDINISLIFSTFFHIRILNFILRFYLVGKVVQNCEVEGKYSCFKSVTCSFIKPTRVNASRSDLCCYNI